MARAIDQAWKDFPALTQKIDGRGFAYLDSAATTLKPWPVIERVSRFLSFESVNVHRGSYRLSDKATLAFERSREEVRKLINAQATDEIIFTKGATESINLIANSLSQFHILRGDAVVVTELEHHSNWVPWQMVCERVGAKLLVVKTDSNGNLDFAQMRQYLSEYSVKVLAITALSNALGVLIDLAHVKKLIEEFPKPLLLVDAAQAIGYIKLDVNSIGCDFLVFSGHKLFGPYGVGVAYLNKKISALMPPYQGGGAMVDRVSKEKTTYLDAPFRFEAGTPNIEGVIGLGAAIEYFNQWSHDEIQSYQQTLYQQALVQLKEFKSVTLFGESRNKAATLSFKIDGAHPSDVAHLLNEENVFVRGGHHCCQPLMERLGVPGTVRASFSIYTRPQDVERFIKALKKAESILL